jgi:hypothetical protein
VSTPAKSETFRIRAQILDGYRPVPSDLFFGMDLTGMGANHVKYEAQGQKPTIRIYRQSAAPLFGTRRFFVIGFWHLEPTKGSKIPCPISITTL